MNNKDYIITQHAKDRMNERGISEDELEKVLEDPEISYTGTKGEKKLEKTPIRIITFIWLIRSKKS